jgi:hypothetical protein
VADLERERVLLEAEAAGKKQVEAQAQVIANVP